MSVFMQDGNIRSRAASKVIRFLKISKILFIMFPVTFSFRDVRHLQMVQCIKWSGPECLVTCTPGAGKGRQKAVVLSGGSGMDQVFRQELLLAPSSDILSVLVRNCVSFSTAAITTFELAGVPCVRPAFTCAARVTLRVWQWFCYSRRNTLASGRLRSQ